MDITTTAPEGLTPIELGAAARPLKRCAIVGTASTWRQTPWQDTGLDILGLNDGFMLGYRLNGLAALPRETIHFDLHPFAQMAFRPLRESRVDFRAVAPGAYLRPAGYLDWLKSRPFPIYLNQAPKDWPHAQTFPRKELEAKYGTYFCSTPAWMLVWAIEQGYTEIHVYGIHLATEWEYISQRPNFEFWLRHAIDRGIKIVLPHSCPLLKTKHVYAYELKPDIPLQDAIYRIATKKQEGLRVKQQLEALPWYATAWRQTLRAQLERVECELADLQQTQHRLRLLLTA